MSFAKVKTEFRQWPTLTRAVVLVGLLALVSLLIWHVLFIYNFANGHPRADQWRHLDRIVLPLSSGEVGTKILWSNHHPNPLLHFYQLLISGPIFGWDVRKDAYFSLGLHILIFAGIAAAFLRHTKTRSHPFLLFGLMATGLYFFFFQTPTTWLWTLVSLQSLGFALGIIILFCLARYGVAKNMDSSQPGRDFRITLALSFATIFAILMNFDYGVIFFLSSLGAMILVAIFHRDRSMARQLPIYAVLSVIGMLLIKWLLLPSGDEDADSNASIVSLITSSPDLVKAYFFSLSSAFWGEAWFRDVAIKGDGVFIPALCIAFTTIVFLAAAVAALVKGRRGLLMLGLMIYSALFSLAVFTARDAGDFTLYLSAPRYATNFKFGWVGALLALTLFAVEATRLIPKRAWVGVTAPVMLVALVTGFFASWQGWSDARFVRAVYDRDELLLYQYGTDDEVSFDLPSTLVGFNQKNDAAVRYLVKNEMAVFSPHYRPGLLLEEYKRMKEDFDPVEDTILTVSLASSSASQRPANRREGCTDLENLSTTAPTRLNIDHETDRPRFVARLRVRGQNYLRTFSATQGQSYIYIQPETPNVKLCSSSSIEISN